jgi:putative phosphoesterase
MSGRIGIISDTHGLMRPEALRALAGVDHILHAGDVGAPEVLERLRELAPVSAVRGNVDRGAWAQVLPETELVEAAGRTFYLVHDLDDLDVDPAAIGLCAVVSGHSHQPAVLRRRGVLYVNPGSAGPRRFRLPVTVGLIDVSGRDGVSPEIVHLL